MIAYDFLPVVVIVLRRRAARFVSSGRLTVRAHSNNNVKTTDRNVASAQHQEMLEATEIALLY
jgi:hypothetical protein